MASLDIGALLREISPDAPCGDDLEYDAAFIALEQKAKEIPEIQIGDKIVVPYQPPNWKEVRKDVLELLGRTLDLRLLLILVRANLSLEGVAGLKEPLALLQEAIGTYWDSVHPRLDPEDDNDPTLRVNILEGLCDSDSVLRELSNAPLVESKAIGRFSLRQMQIAVGKLNPPEDEEAPKLATIHAAFADADPGRLQETSDALKASLGSVVEIERFVTEQVGMDNAPNLDPLRSVLKEALHNLDEHMGLPDGGAAETVDEDASQETAQATGGGVVSQHPQGSLGGVGSRQDVIRALDLICDYYAKHEPASPVPLLARRAKRLVTMDFMEIMNDLAPEGLAQINLIKGHDPNENEE
ncbi:hypothetical protein ANRL3_02402 [Anaerolineae bacterium]|nr:hypothetical protein ANRL3_02402 [Anaerolineae bacterium]